MQHLCTVKSCKAANDSIYCVLLEPEQPQTIEFMAGQYLQIILPGGESSAFSIASSPRTPELIELNILELTEQNSSQRILNYLRSNNPVTIELPMGDCYLPERLEITPEVPIILVAAGTGFAQMKSMLYEIFSRKLSNPVHLYWGNKQASGFYHTDLLQAWHQEHSNFHYHLVVSDAQESCQWLGREGLLYETIHQDFDSLEDCRLCISGSPAMVYATIDELYKHGLKQEHAYSDVFSYAPRDS